MIVGSELRDAYDGGGYGKGWTEFVSVVVAISQV